MILVNGQSENRIEIVDRGLQYGDGLFETLAYRNGKFEFLEAHLQRLSIDCQRLNIPFVDLDLLRQELTSISTDLTENTVVKVIITRGSGGRGYYADKSLIPTRIISTHPFPNYPESYQTEGVAVRFCEHHLSESTALAGVKHLNRLDQVIARSEWSDQAIAEGLMFDQHDKLIEGTMSNIFLIKSGQLYTPKLVSSGVSGIMRSQIIKLARKNSIPVSELATLVKSDLIESDELFVCNSVNRIWPVKHIIDTKQSFSVGEITKLCQSQVAKALD